MSQYSWSEFTENLEKDYYSFRNLFRMMREHGEGTEAELWSADGTCACRSYAECAAAAERACGNVQRSIRFPHGNLVGLSYRSNPDWPVLFWGIMMAGWIPLLLNPEADDAVNAGLLREVRAVAYVAEKPITGSDSAFVSAADILGPGEPGQPDWENAVALCTSGTTGESRVFLYSGASVVNQLSSFDDAHRVNEDIPFSDINPCKVLAFLPFHHVFGFMTIYILYASAGKTIVYLTEKSLRNIYAACRSQRITHLFAVPMFFNALAAEIKAGGEKNGRLLGNDIRYMISGGGLLPEDTLRTINEAGYPLYNGFGMTECGILTVETSHSAEQRIQGGVGKPFHITEYRVEPHPVGELLIRGSGLYTATVKDGVVVPRDTDAWLKTGDVVRLTEDNMFFVGRNKDVIINAGGENIYPDELEKNYSGIPGVKRFCILGLKKGVYEEICYVAEVPQDAEDGAIAAAVLQRNQGRALGEQVARVLLSEEPLPVSNGIKVKRLTLKAAIEDGSFPVRECSLRKAENAAKAAEAECPPELAEIKEKIRAIVAEELLIDADSIGDTDNFARDLNGESLLLISAVCSMEDAFGVVLSDTEIHAMSNVEASADIIYAKLHGEAAAQPSAPSAPSAGHRITDFTESEQYQALHARMKESFPDDKSPYLIPHEGLTRDTSVVYGKRVINLGTNNYLGMSGNPEVIDAAIQALRVYGTSASGSRTLSSDKTLYRTFEKQLAAWKHTEDAIVCSGGWAENLSFVSCFMQAGDMILYDSLSHNSIMQGIALSTAESKPFAHNDLAMLEDILKRIDGQYNKVLIFAEGVYSMDGDIAPIPDFVRLKKQYRCFLMVDEAHALGVIGENGGGVDDYFGLAPDDIDIKSGTLSKALGCCGGYIAAKHSIVEYLRYNMAAYVYSTGISPALAAGSMKALEIMQRDNSLVTKLHENVAYFIRRCKEEGMNTCLAGESGIIPVLIGADVDAAALSERLLENGIFVPASMYPAVPMGKSRIRFSLSAVHSIEQLEQAVSTMARLMREMGFLPDKNAVPAAEKEDNR